MTTANAVTGQTGHLLSSGFDTSDIRPLEAGYRISHWDRQVSYQGEDTLDNILTKDKYLKYNLIAHQLKDDGVSLSETVEMYFSGKVKELRIHEGRQTVWRYRIYGDSYLGKRK